MRFDVVGEEPSVLDASFLPSAVKEIQEEIVATSKDRFEFFNSRHGAELAESVQSTLEGSILLDDEVRSCPDCPEPKPVSDSIGIHDTINYVYTSGTTGMPKACLLSHLRLDPWVRYKKLIKIIALCRYGHFTHHCESGFHS